MELNGNYFFEFMKAGYRQEQITGKQANNVTGYSNFWYQNFYKANSDYGCDEG